MVYRQYQALWTELNARRRAAASDPAWQARLAAAPTILPTNLDPFAAFGHYPTAHLDADTLVACAATQGLRLADVHDGLGICHSLLRFERQPT